MKKSHIGDLHTGLSLNFGATGLESGTSSAEVVKSVEVVSSVEVTVEVVIVASDDDDNDDGISIAEGKVKTFNNSQLKHKTWRFTLKE